MMMTMIDRGRGNYENKVAESPETEIGERKGRKEQQSQPNELHGENQIGSFAAASVNGL